MKNMKRVLKTVLAVVSITFFVLYILFYIINSTVSADDFFRSNVSETALLVMCVLAATVGGVLIAENRRALRRRLKRGKRDGGHGFMKTIKRILPHVCIVIPGMYLVFYCINFVNPIMNFIYHPMTEGLLLALAIVGVLCAAMLLTDTLKPKKHSRSRRKAAKQG